MRAIRAVDLHLSEEGYVARSSSPDAMYSPPLNARVVTFEITSLKNASDVSDHDLMAGVTCVFIMHATWRNLSSRSAIQRLRLNGNDSH